MMYKRTTLWFLVLGLIFTWGCQGKKGGEPSTTILEKNWKIFPSSEANATGDKISSANFDANLGHNASVPGTVMANLVRNGDYPDIFKGMNLEKVDKKPFQQPWWYRTSFQLTEIENSNFELTFEGLNYKANIWLNGKKIADEKNVENPFRIFNYNVTPHLLAGENILAVEIIPPKRGDLTIGFVDWNPAAPDENMGLWRPVKLKKTGAVGMKDLFVQTDLDVKDLTKAEIKLSTELTNYSAEKKTATVNATIGAIKVSKTVELNPQQTLSVSLGVDEFPELKIDQPKLWWPNGLGEAHLYNLEANVTVNGTVNDATKERFGIRKIDEYVNAEGHKGWKVNGQEVLIKGAGWVDDIFLDDSDAKVKAQLDYVKHMNMNTVRLEGFWGKNKTIYDVADENGLLIMIGWSCHWEWEAYCGRKEDHYLAIRTDDEMKLHTQSYVDQVKWLRNHPSVFLWVFGSDKLPLPKLEKMLNEQITAADPTRPILASCKWWDYGTEHYNTSEITGPTGVKMLGPYSYVAPNYWYIADKAGGAFGFNTETGPGPQVPPVQGLKKMLPEANMWPIDTVWNYHCGRHEFGTLNRYLAAYDNRYGKSTSVEDFAAYSQVSNYEAIRPMFEAFAVNRPNSTGVIQWMLNSAWPEMFWQLYDWYLIPNGAFYGTQNACLPVNAIYNYKDKNIYITNEYASAQNDLNIDLKVLDINSKVVFEKQMKTNAPANSSAKAFDMPELKNVTSTYFLVMKLTDKSGKVLADKWYWLSTKNDEYDFNKTSWVGTPLTDFADLNGIRDLAKVKAEVKHEIVEEGNDVLIKVNIKNPSDKIAFFIELRAENEKGELVVPVFWTDNYVSLLPGEEKSYTARVAKELLQGKPLKFGYSGINVEK